MQNNEQFNHSKQASETEQTLSIESGRVISDYKKRFFTCFAITIPIILLTLTVEGGAGLQGKFFFHGDVYIVFVLSSLVYFYGGFLFLKGMFNEIKKHKPGMMTIIAIVISAAYFYSSYVLFTPLNIRGIIVFWEMAVFTDIMLLISWIVKKDIPK